MDILIHSQHFIALSVCTINSHQKDFPLSNEVRPHIDMIDGIGWQTRHYLLLCSKAFYIGHTFQTHDSLITMAF